MWICTPSERAVVRAYASLRRLPFPQLEQIGYEDDTVELRLRDAERAGERVGHVIRLDAHVGEVPAVQRPQSRQAVQQPVRREPAKRCRKARARARAVRAFLVL